MSFPQTRFSEWYNSLWNDSLVDATRHRRWPVNAGLGNGSVLSNTKALLEPMLLNRLWCCIAVVKLECINTLRPRQNGRHFADDTFKRIFVNENVRILIEISLKFVPKGPINNIPALVQIMAWRRPGDKPLSEPMMVCLPTHICVTRPQWVNTLYY